MPMAVICGQRINSIHIIKRVEVAFNIIYKNVFDILILIHLGCWFAKTPIILKHV